MMEGVKSDDVSLERPPDMHVGPSAGEVEVETRKEAHEKQESEHLEIPPASAEEEVIAEKEMEKEADTIIENERGVGEERIDGKARGMEQISEAQEIETNEDHRVKLDIPEEQVIASNEAEENDVVGNPEDTEKQAEELDTFKITDAVATDTKEEEAMAVHDSLPGNEPSQVFDDANPLLLEAMEQASHPEVTADEIVEQSATANGSLASSETKEQQDHLIDTTSSIIDLAPDTSNNNLTSLALDSATQDVAEKKHVSEAEILIAPSSAQVEEKEESTTNLKEVKDVQKSNELLPEQSKEEETTNQVLPDLTEQPNSIETSAPDDTVFKEAVPAVTTSASTEPTLPVEREAVSSDLMVPQQSTDPSSSGIVTPPLETLVAATVALTSENKTVTDAAEVPTHSVPIQTTQEPAADTAPIDATQTAPPLSTVETQAPVPTQTSVNDVQEIKQTSTPIQAATVIDEKAKSTADPVPDTANSDTTTTAAIASAPIVITPPVADEHIVKQIALVLKINKELIRLCVDLQGKELASDILFKHAALRLQSNLAFLASIADRSTKTSPPVKESPVTILHGEPFPATLHAPESQLPRLYQLLRSLNSKQSDTETASSENTKRPRSESESDKGKRKKLKEQGNLEKVSLTAVPSQQKIQAQPSEAAPLTAMAAPIASMTPPRSNSTSNQLPPPPPPPPSTSTIQSNGMPNNPQQIQNLTQAFGANAVMNLNVLQSHYRGQPQAVVSYMEANVPGFRNLPIQVQMQQMTNVQQAAMQRQRQQSQGSNGAQPPQQQIHPRQPSTAHSSGTRSPMPAPQMATPQQARPGTPQQNPAFNQINSPAAISNASPASHMVPSPTSISYSSPQQLATGPPTSYGMMCGGGAQSMAPMMANIPAHIQQQFLQQLQQQHQQQHPQNFTQNNNAFSPLQQFNWPAAQQPPS